MATWSPTPAAEQPSAAAQEARAELAERRLGLRDSQNSDLNKHINATTLVEKGPSLVGPATDGDTRQESNWEKVQNWHPRKAEKEWEDGDASARDGVTESDGGKEDASGRMEGRRQVPEGAVEQKLEEKARVEKVPSKSRYPKPRPTGKVCILALDGGGVRGIIPARILARLEVMLQEKSGDPDLRLADFFDLMAGTSAGGILAGMLASPNGQGRPMFTAAAAGTFFADNASTIFPASRAGRMRALKMLFRPKYSSRGLEALARDYQTTPEGHPLTLKDVIRPVLITSYDIMNGRPVFFMHENAAKSPSHNFYLRDVSRATSSAPGLFKPAKIKSVDKKTTRVCIDGGVICNNPALAALHHVISHPDSFSISPGGRRSAKDILLLSLGTGKDQVHYDYKKAKKWGMFSWAGPLLDVMVWGTGDMVHYQTALLFTSADCERNYLRIENKTLPDVSKKMDNTSRDNIDTLHQLADEVLLEKVSTFDPSTGELLQASEDTNFDRLEWFADQLVAERQARLGNVAPGDRFVDAAVEVQRQAGVSSKKEQVDVAQAFQQ